MTEKADSTPSCQPRVLIADDDQDTRDILSDLLAHYGYEPIVAKDGEEALALASAQSLALALVDVRMPGPSGIALAGRLKELQPEMEVVIITAYGSAEDAAEAVRRGAFHYLAKPLRRKRVLAVVKEAWVAQQARVQVLGDLTGREREVLALLAEGKTDAEIAVRLNIERGTASTHVHNLLGKLGVKNRVQAAVLWERYARGRPQP